MSIASQGRSRLNCVCRWASGFSSAFSPAIHIFAGENVCIQQITPMQRSAAFASRHAWRMDSAVVTTLSKTTRARRLGRCVDPLNDLATVSLHLPKRPLAIKMLAAG